MERVLCALALGTLFACSGGGSEDPYAQDRNVSGLDVPDLDSLVADSIASGTLPAARSGWKLTWSSPLNTDGWESIYVWTDTLTEAQRDKLPNGKGHVDFASLGIPEPAESLGIADTGWDIPSAVFGGAQGNRVRADTAWWFSVWARYESGEIGPVVRYRLYLGDEMPPEIPDLGIAVAGDSVVLSFERPSDQTGRFDTLLQGPLQDIRALYWPGRTAKDSSTSGVSNVSRSNIPADEVADAAHGTYQLALRNLGFSRDYVVVLQVVDSAGNIASSAPIQVQTCDSIPPSVPSALAVDSLTGNGGRIGWAAPTDSFVAGVAATNAPNSGIASFEIWVGPPGGTFWKLDSLDLTAYSGRFGASSTYLVPQSGYRFRWTGSTGRWTWSWPAFAPGDSLVAKLVVRDTSGNYARDTPTVAFRTTSTAGFSCPEGYVPVPGSTSAKDFCIERYEHGVRDGAPSTSVTWSQAKAACEAEGATLCSDEQWTRACQTGPWSLGTLDYGVLSTGDDDESDTLARLQELCHVSSGDSTGNADTALRDPRCQSGWGVRDLPGRYMEWTLDTYRTTAPDSGLDAWSGAWTGASDLSDTAFGTLKGGTWRIPLSSGTILPSARCTNRSYTAGSDSLEVDGTTYVRPLPSGKGVDIGFRCCAR